MANHRIEKNKQDQIVKMHLEGKTNVEIARIVGAGHTTVERYIRGHKAAKAARNVVLMKNLAKARKALAAKRALGPVPMPAKAVMKSASRKYDDTETSRPEAIPAPRPAPKSKPTPGFRVQPSPDATLREITAAANTLGLEVHFQFVKA